MGCGGCEGGPNSMGGGSAGHGGGEGVAMAGAARDTCMGILHLAKFVRVMFWLLTETKPTPEALVCSPTRNMSPPT